MPRENPYSRLKRAAMKWVSAVKYAKRSRMWTYEIKSPGDSWRLLDLREWVAAADQIGFDVRLEVNGNNLEVWYVKRPPETPWELDH